MLPEYFARWTVDEIGTLDQVAFITTFPAPFSESFTLLFWYYASLPHNKQVIVTIDDLLEIYLEANELIVSLLSRSPSNNPLKIRQPSLEAWHQIAVSIGANVDLYVDGHLVADQPLRSTITVPTESTICIGGYTDSAGGHFNYTFGRNQTGWVDDIRWYPQVLNADQIHNLQPTHVPVPTVNFEAKHLDNGIVKFKAIAHNIRFFLWKFDPYQSASGTEVSHQYAFSGDYRVRLTAVSQDYQQVVYEDTITITGQGQSPSITPVFVNGQEGYACYRIPSIVRAINGDLVAFAEGRVESCSDSTATIRLVCKRSQDNGKTWSPLQVVARNLIDGQEFVVQQNAPIVDSVHRTGRIIVLYNKLETSEFEIAKGNGSSRIFCIWSDDNGITWHSETELTEQVHRPAQWRIQRPTLGHAIQLRSGRLFFAGMLTVENNSVFQSQNYVFWSDDLGDTWTIGGIVPHIGLNEATAVELENREIMINSRAYQDEQPVGRRAVTVGYFVDDQTMRFHETNFDKTLIDPTIQASIIRYTFSSQAEYGSKNRLLFTNPNHAEARYNLTMRLSYDEGHTWAVSKTLDTGPSAYSDIVIQADMRIGVLYEQGNQGGIHYMNFTLDWLTHGIDVLESET